MPEGKIKVGPPDGMTIDKAIDICVQQNIDLQAQRLEISMAEADILTANLRGNPIFYADNQLVPYGHYSFRRPGGPAQADVNVTYPLDITRKRRFRTIVAQRAKRVAEAQMIDAVRNQVDTLYTYFGDNVAAEITVEFSRKFAQGLRRLLKLNEDLKGAGFITPPDVLAIKSQLEQAELAIKEAEGGLQSSRQNLALVLNMPLADAPKIQVRDFVRDVRPLPLSREQLVDRAYESRPDLVAAKLAVERAHADVDLGRPTATPMFTCSGSPTRFRTTPTSGSRARPPGPWA